MEIPDDKLLQQARDGDRLAFRKIVEANQASMIATVVGILGRDIAVDDIVQESFVRLYKNLDNFEGRSSIRTYLTRIAVNLSLDHLRKRRRDRSRQTSIEDAGEARMAVSEGQDHDYDHDLILQSIQKLPADQRAVVTLRVLDGYSTQETAELLDIKYGTVLSRLSRGLDRLKTELKPYFYPGEIKSNG